MKPIRLRELFYDFLKKNPIPPIKVVEVMALNQPSPINANRFDVTGLDTQEAVSTLSDADHLYQPVDGLGQLAVSIFFKRELIPAIIAI